MYASELTAEHIGQDLTITMSGILTGGIVEKIGTADMFGMITVTIDGQEFMLDEDKEVMLHAELDPRQMILEQPDITIRHQLMDRLVLEPA